MIIAVASPPGAGKTHWIHQQLAQTNKPVGYFSPQTDSLPIDSTYLQSEYPQLKLYQTGEEAELNDTTTYLEIPWDLDLAKSEPNKLPKLNTTQQPPVSEEEMRQAVRTLLLGLGEDPDREGLKDTPKRVVKALKFLTSGYNQSLDELLIGIVIVMKYIISN